MIRLLCISGLIVLALFLLDSGQLVEHRIVTMTRATVYSAPDAPARRT